MKDYFFKKKMFKMRTLMLDLLIFIEKTKKNWPCDLLFTDAPNEAWQHS